MTLTAAYREAVRRACHAGTRRHTASQTDHELLDDFRRRRDESAFEELLRRHGPMVRAVCRRTLGEHDADDAFQATFLVLVRRADSVRRGAPLANWLCGVAYRTARQALRDRLRRWRRERTVTALPEVSISDRPPEEVRPRLDAALQGLPEKYRVPLILCDLEGRSRSEAASQLRLAEGTLSSRLARARALLRRRLGGAAGTLAATAPILVPPSLARATVRAAVAFLADAPLPAGTVPARVLDLVNGVIQTMRLSKWKAGLVTVALLAAAGATALGFGMTGVRPLSPAARADDPPTASPRNASPPPPAEEKRLQGVWQLMTREEDGSEDARSEDVRHRDVVFIFAGSRFLQAGRGNLAEGTFRLHADRNPAGIDILDLKITEGGDGSPGGISKYGIYKLEGDRLTLCFGPDGQRLRRPAEFATEKGSDCMLVTLRRVGATPAEAPPAAVSRPPAGAEKVNAVVTERSIKIPIAIDPARRSEVREITLFVSDDGGKTWKQSQTIGPDAAGFEFEATQPGVYSFKVVVTDRSGRKDPADLTSGPPALRVVVRQVERSPHPPPPDPDAESRQTEFVRSLKAQAEAFHEQLGMRHQLAEAPRQNQDPAILQEALRFAVESHERLLMALGGLEALRPLTKEEDKVYATAALRLARYRADAGEYEAAADTYKKLLSGRRGRAETVPGYAGLVDCYLKLGRKGAVRDALRQMRAALVKMDEDQFPVEGMTRDQWIKWITERSED